jgi:hypothetical protein
MRKLALAIAIGVLASVGGFGAPVPKAAAASSNLKVVIIVGPVEGLTASYRANADVAAAEFLKFTSNVVKVYSPNATWSAVQAASDGAAVLVYLGHGNGYPNPYNPKLYTDRDDGMGLNYASGSYAHSDNHHTYYGSQYMADLNLAANAVVILNHLCYASGDSEPGKGKPTLSVAMSRVDHFAEGFIQGGAEAVIAEGMNGLNSYIDGIFTPGLTLDSIWKNYPGNHNHFSSWNSSRNPGYTSQIDPDLDHPQSDGDVYYRSMVSLPGLTTDQVGVGITYAAATFHAVVPTRLLDSRSGLGFSGKLSPNSPKTFQITGRSLNGGGTVPMTATAVTGTLTVTGSTGGWAVYLGPTPRAYPSSSTVNFPAGYTVANGVTVPLSAAGSLSATYLANAGSATDLIFDLTGYFTPGAGGNTFHPLTPPARLVDSRQGFGLAGKLTAGQPGTFAVWSHAGVPDNATAITGNVTSVNSTTGGAIYVGPNPVVSPDSWSVNFHGRQVVASSVTIGLSATGTLSVTYLAAAGNTTDVVFDVTGYFTGDASGDQYVPLTPVRLLDTRTGHGIASKLSVNAPRGLQITGRGGVPSGASGMTANATVTNETNGWAIYFGPVAVAKPTSSFLNFVKGDIRANGLAVAFGSGGGVYVTYLGSGSNTTHLVLDVSGYFIHPAP